MKLHTISFGCQMSAADSEEMSRPLLARGYQTTAELDDADAVIVSTCTVRQHAEDKAVSQIGRLKAWKDARPERFVIVAGCAAERLGEWIEKRFPHVDLVVGATRIEMYPLLLEQALRARFDWANDNAGSWEPGLLGPTHAPGAAHVTIMRGCNYACSYCIVPLVRGPELNRPLEAVAAEARMRAEKGVVEITLLGQTVNAYRHEGRDFADLLRTVAAVPGVQRLRFMSPHPFYLKERMIAAMTDCPQINPHLHLPVQSGSDRMLKVMRRNYTRKEYLERVGALRKALPDFQLSTDLIVGFPGETDAEFRETLSLVKEADFCAAYCYKYSPREGTEAASLSEQISQELKEERLAQLLELVDAQTKRHLETFVGRRVKLLLVDETDGQTDGHFKARLDAPGKPGTIVEAEITGATRTALKARALELACRP